MTFYFFFPNSDASPGSQLVSEKFQVDWAWYLASTKNFIVAQIDGRGSGFQVSIYFVNISKDQIEKHI